MTNGFSGPDVLDWLDSLIAKHYLEDIAFPSSVRLGV